MAKNFDMKSLLNNKSNSINSGPKASFPIQNLDIGDIAPDERNFYSVDDVQMLKASIQMNGLEQNLVVRKDPTRNKYVVISGHRRLKALQMLVGEGYEEFRAIPCKISVAESLIDDIKTELRLIFGNATSRTLSYYEKTQQAIRMKELLTALKDSGEKIPGRLRSLIAETLKTTPSNIGRMENIAGNLAPEFKNEFKSGGIKISVANELAGLPQEKQREVYDVYQENGKITVDEVKQYKVTVKKNTPSSATPPAPVSVPEKATPIPHKNPLPAQSPAQPHPVTHDLKTWADSFDAIAAGIKPWEYRLNDRDYNVGDILHLMRYDHTKGEYTGQTLDLEVIYISGGGIWGIPENYVIMSLALVANKTL